MPVSMLQMLKLWQADERDEKALPTFLAKFDGVTIVGNLRVMLCRKALLNCFSSFVFVTFGFCKREKSLEQALLAKSVSFNESMNLNHISAFNSLLSKWHCKPLC